MLQLAWISPYDDESPFPPVETALREPDGLLAYGGNLSPRRLLLAYRHGIFPWFSDDQPILWWSPDPRMVLTPSRVKVSRSLAKTLRKGLFRFTFDRAFGAVIAGCAAPRRGEPGTWITPEMEAAYLQLHRLGHAHSLEVWHGDELVGGLYGVAVGKVFFGESMFSRMSDASKAATVCLAHQLEAWGFPLIDCQMSTEHLQRLGAGEIPRRDFSALLDRWCEAPGRPGPWQFDIALPGQEAS